MKSKNVFQIVFTIISSYIKFGQLQCLTNWATLTPPMVPACKCMLSVTAPATTTFMSSPRICINIDARSNLIYYDGEVEKASINALAGTLSAYGIANVPVGLYSDNDGNIRHLYDQAITPPLLNVTGKCQYLLATGSLATNTSCLQQPQNIVCMMDCGPPASPPAPLVTTGTDRCNDPNFSMAPSEPGWVVLNGVWYKAPTTNVLMSKSEAASACASIGGWLPSFANLNEWQAVMNYVYTVGVYGADSWAAPLWLGGTLAGTSATWDDGTPWTFEYWAPYQPLGQTTCMWWSVGQGDYWSEGNCSVPGVVFCQYYVCPTTTTVPTTMTLSTNTTSTLNITTLTPTTTTSKPTNITKTTTATSNTATTGFSSVTSSSDCANSYKNDFSKSCLQNVNAFYKEGVCYIVSSAALTHDQTAVQCQNMFNGRLAIIRSADVAEAVKEKTMLITGNIGEGYYLWVQTPNNDPTIYKQINNTVSMDGKHELIISRNNLLHSLIYWHLPTDTNIYITSATPFFDASDSNLLSWGLCETLPQFQQKGCDQALTRSPCIVVDTLTAPNSTDCGIQCGLTSWCTGFNYNLISLVCEMLNENTISQGLICDVDWVYYERI